MFSRTARRAIINEVWIPTFFKNENKMYGPESEIHQGGQQYMKVGSVREIKNNEFRVGLTPDNVRAYVKAGHAVYMEKGAGEGSGFADDDYIKAGAVLMEDPAEVWQTVDMMRTGIAKPLKTRGSSRTSLPERTARCQSPMTKHDTASATRSRTASPGSRTGGGSQHATTGARRSSCQHAPWLPSSCSGYES